MIDIMKRNGRRTVSGPAALQISGAPLKSRSSMLPESPGIIADATQVETIATTTKLVNLLSKAIDSMEDKQFGSLSSSEYRPYFIIDTLTRRSYLD